VPYPPCFHTGPCFPGDGHDGLNRIKVSETFASFTELRETVKDLLLGRDTKARRNVQIFRQLLHLPPFATLQREPQLNFALACWLQDWEILFWQWQNQAACDSGMCRVPTRDDYVHEAKARNDPHPEFRQPCGREHPFINCSTSLNDVLNIWHVPPGPDLWQHRMWLDVAKPAVMDGAAQSVSLRWLLYHADVQGAPHGLHLSFKTPPRNAHPNLIFLSYGVAEIDSSLVGRIEVKGIPPQENAWLSQWVCMHQKKPNDIAFCPTEIVLMRLKFQSFLQSSYMLEACACQRGEPQSFTCYSMTVVGPPPDRRRWDYRRLHRGVKRQTTQLPHAENGFRADDPTGDVS
jgi:hypothetical protein